MLFSPVNDLIITACDQPELPRVEVCDSLHSPSVFCLRALKGRRTCIRQCHQIHLGHLLSDFP